MERAWRGICYLAYCFFPCSHSEVYSSYVSDKLLFSSVDSARINFLICKEGKKPKSKSTVTLCLSLWNRQSLITYTSGKSLSNARK